MGGLLGILGLDQAGRAEAHRRMVAAAPHQGRANDTITLGHCLLGTVDDPGMPESGYATDSGLAVAFSGRLDNVNELIRRFELDANASPARVILETFGLLGETSPSVLRGSFAAAVTDGDHLWCFRDHVGFDRLFFRHDGSKLLVASEPKQVVAGAGIRREPDLEVVERIFFAEDYDETRCALAGVERVPRSTVLIGERTGVRTRRYWDPEGLLETARLSEDDVSETFDRLMAQAAARALSGQDVIALSGGIDSPAVAAYAAPAHREIWGRPLTAFSEVYPDFPDSDELAYIQEVVRVLDIPHHTYVPQPQRLEDLPTWVELFDTPWQIWSAEGAMERYTKVRSLGFRTILTGFVAEDVMGGPRYVIPHYLWHRKLTALMQTLQMHKRHGTPLKWMAKQIVSAFVPARLMALRRLRNPVVYVPEWVDGHRVALNYASEVVSPRKQWSAHQLGVFSGVGTSGEADRISQVSNGVRVRSPWADVDLWEFFLSLPAEVKIPGLESKDLARRLLRNRVPDVILDRQDKTLMNQWFEETSFDYPTLRKLVANPHHRLNGVDYELLAQRLEDGDLDLGEYLWAKDLAIAHAFLAQW